MPHRPSYLPGLIALLLVGGCRDQPNQNHEEKEGSKPERIITLTPSATEVVAAVGALDRIVAVDRFSERPAAVESLPEVGDFLHPNLEEIVRLEPDLVVLDADQGKAKAALQRAGLEVLALPMHTLEDVKEGLEKAGEALGTGDEAGAAIAGIERAEKEVRARARGREASRRVLLAIDRELGGLGGLVTAGPGSYLDDLLTLVGGENAIAEARVRYPRLSPEEVLEARPDVILDAVHTEDPGKAAADWEALDVPAVRADRVHVLEDAIFLSPGPRVAEALRRLERLVWAE